jgi:antibiotic biosynthesis monooxygenase (ABM) superfamily enzyme
MSQDKVVSPYDAKWREFRFLTRLGVGAFIAAILFFSVSFVTKDVRFFTFAGLCWIAMMIVAAVQSYFRCPRCSGLFSYRGWLPRQSVRRRCVHCGLRLYE